MATRVGDRAVVLGGSMAGLLAARVLAEHYPEVVVVDRDTLSGVTGARRGVPQARHAHSLHGRGQQIVEELFPGMRAELVAAGAPTGDLGRMRWHFDGNLMQPADSGVISVTADRPVLEAHVRARVAKLPAVRFLEGHDIAGIATTPDGARVVGVQVRRRTRDSAEETLRADLVVDASGRGSRTPAWVAALGYPRVEEELVKIDLTYTTRRFRLRRDPFRGDQSINPVATPAHPRGAFFGRVGTDSCILSLTGVLGDRPPTDPGGFLEYTRSLPVPEIYNAVRDAEPLDEAVSFRFPASQRRRYERLGRFPARLLVIGDAACSFNPVYGQGMTVAALEAMALRRHLRRGQPPTPQDWHRDIAGLIDAPWDVAAGGDLAFPGVPAPRPLKVKLANAYMGRLQRAAIRDADLTAAFMRVAGLIDPPQALMRPRLLLRVLFPRTNPHPRPVAPDQRDRTADTTTRPTA